MKLWIAILWNAMGKTGNGYKRDSLRHTGKGVDRRNDKLLETTDDDGKRVFVARWESKIARRARLGTLGVRA